MALTSSERARFHDMMEGLYTEGYAEGMEQTARRLPVGQHAAGAARQMGPKLKARQSLVDKAVDSYLKRLQGKRDELVTQGLAPNHVAAELAIFADGLADDKGQLISELEFSQARMDGAGALVGESGEKYEWRFPHFELGSAGHTECPICLPIRRGSPYTSEQAEVLGFPGVPHPNCDHGWVLVPLGEESRTEEFPPVAGVPGATGKFAGENDGPHKLKARQELRDAVASGEVKRPSKCSSCQGGGKIHAHHEDYDKPMQVKWLCTDCHGRKHSKGGGKCASADGEDYFNTNSEQGFPDLSPLEADLARRPKADPQYGHGVAHGLRFNPMAYRLYSPDSFRGRMTWRRYVSLQDLVATQAGVQPDVVLRYARENIDKKPRANEDLPLVYDNPADPDTYIVDGHHRIEAARMLGQDRVEVQVVNP